MVSTPAYEAKYPEFEDSQCYLELLLYYLEYLMASAEMTNTRVAVLFYSSLRQKND